MNSHNNVILINDFINQKDFDDIIQMIDLYSYSNDYPGWKLNGFSNQEDTNKRFWFIDLIDNEYFNKQIFEKIKLQISKLFDDDVILDRVYLNGSTFGQQGYFHIDDTLENSRTLLIYCNSEWKNEWVGGTVFETLGGIQTIYPLPKRAAYFDARIPHFSQPLSKDFDGLRVTLAYKLLLK